MFRAYFKIEIVGIGIDEVSFYLQISEKTLSPYIMVIELIGVQFGLKSNA